MTSAMAKFFFNCNICNIGRVPTYLLFMFVQYYKSHIRIFLSRYNDFNPAVKGWLFLKAKVPTQSFVRITSANKGKVKVLDEFQEVLSFEAKWCVLEVSPARLNCGLLASKSWLLWRVVYAGVALFETKNTRTFTLVTT